MPFSGTLTKAKTIDAVAERNDEAGIRPQGHDAAPQAGGDIQMFREAAG